MAGHSMGGELRVAALLVPPFYDGVFLSPHNMDFEAAVLGRELRFSSVMSLDQLPSSEEIDQILRDVDFVVMGARAEHFADRFEHAAEALGLRGDRLWSGEVTHAASFALWSVEGRGAARRAVP